MILNQYRNSRPGYGKKELAYTLYNGGLIGLIRSREWSKRPRSTLFTCIYPALYCFNHINRQLRNLELFHRLCENNYR